MASHRPPLAPPPGTPVVLRVGAGREIATLVTASDGREIALALAADTVGPAADARVTLRWTAGGLPLTASGRSLGAPGEWFLRVRLADVRVRDRRRRARVAPPRELTVAGRAARDGARPGLDPFAGLVIDVSDLGLALLVPPGLEPGDLLVLSLGCGGHALVEEARACVLDVEPAAPGLVRARCAVDDDLRLGDVVALLLRDAA